MSDVNDEVLARLRDDPQIAGVVEADQVNVRVNGRNATGVVLLEPSEFSWTVLEGRIPRAEGEVMLGARSGRALHRSVGDRVVLLDSNDEPVSLAVVGIGTGPDLTDGQFGGGVLLTAADGERVARTQAFRGALIRYEEGADPDALTRAIGSELEVTTPDRPPNVDNLAQLGRLPEFLAAFLGVLLVAVLAQSIAATARRRRRELDTLRAVGFVRRQARGVIQVAALVTVAIGLAVGIPVGVILARIAWGFTARAAYVADDLRIPGPTLLLLVVASFLVAVAVAVVPAWRITHTPIARGLQDE